MVLTHVKSIDNDVKHRKIFTISKILAIFIFLNMANLLLINPFGPNAPSLYPLKTSENRKVHLEQMG